MSFFRKLTSRTSTQPTAPTQPLLQPLERRRLMSLSGALEYPPAYDAPAQAMHLFGYEDHLPSPGAAPAYMSALADSALQPAALPPEVGDLESQYAKATAHGTAAAADAPAAALPTVLPPQAGGNSLSEMYTTLNNSTIAEIDNASTKPGEMTTGIDSHTSDSPVAHGPGLPLQRQAPSAERTAADVATVSPAVPLAALAPAGGAIFQSQSAAVPAEATELRTSTNAIEADLVAIGDLARAAISELGRDMGIELSHLQDDISSVAREMIAPWDAWRFAALTGAAVATAACLQSQASRQNEKTATVFSRQLIEILPGERL